MSKKGPELLEEAYYKRTKTDTFLDCVFDEMHSNVEYLKGRVLTVADAISEDPKRREAVKDLLHQAFKDYYDHRHYVLTREMWERIKEGVGEGEKTTSGQNGTARSLPPLR